MIDKLESEVDLVERHIEIFRRVVTDGPIGIVNLSNETGYPHHKVRYSLRVLEESDLIEPTAQGAVVTDGGREFVSGFNDQLEEVLGKLRDLGAETEPVSDTQ